MKSLRRTYEKDHFICLIAAGCLARIAIQMIAIIGSSTIIRDDENPYVHHYARMLKPSVDQHLRPFYSGLAALPLLVVAVTKLQHQSIKNRTGSPSTILCGAGPG